MAGDMGRFRTAGGWHIELALPLSDRDRAKVDAGELTQVDSDGKPITDKYAMGGEVPPGTVTVENETGLSEPVRAPRPKGHPKREE